MDKENQEDPVLCEIVWIMDCDFKAAMVMLRNEWRRTGQRTYEEAEGSDEEDCDEELEYGDPDDLLVDDDDRYAIVEFFEKEDGSGVERAKRIAKGRDFMARSLRRFLSSAGAAPYHGLSPSSRWRLNIQSISERPTWPPQARWTYVTPLHSALMPVSLKPFCS